MTQSQQAEQPIPDHVPEELFRDFNIDDYTHELDDPYLAGARLLDGPDIFWATTACNGHPGWVLTRHQLVAEAYADPEHFSSERADLAAMGVTWKLNPLEYDPPVHQTYRRLLNPMFTPKAVMAMGEPVSQVCNELLDAIAERGQCEFIADFAEKFPSYIFLDLMGMPREMLNQFMEWERLILRAQDPRHKAGALLSVIAYLDGFVDQQMQDPTSEVMKGIVNAQYEGERCLNKGEIMGMVTLLYIGGLDTVYSTLGWIFQHLARDQALQERLRNNLDLVPQAVDEFLRAYPVAMPHRKVKQDFEFHGVQMRKGDHVLMATFAAHRDPQAYANPHQVDIDRKPRHMAFAAGPHNCLGMHLAKRELRTVVEAVVSRFKNIRLPEGEKPEFHTGGTWGLDRLVLAWDKI
ncbi:cytochrome P450 [Halioxenophilus sp. WMMB6]|uniref:cytochrome P450 n=1 Tax=Halioxenophilus sp. WMMB6 TaxID=3073815 RepID=UPI00295E8182|nr:cytochrome P450 [Halioxenophilus sp. WMMB6]